MTLFLLAATAMFAIAFWLILTPLLKKHTTVVDELADEYDDENINIGRERLRELKADLTAGRIDNTQFNQMRTELEQTVLDAIGTNLPNPPNSPNPKSSDSRKLETMKPGTNLWLMLLLAIVMPCLTLVIYYQIGNTTFLDPKAAEQEQAQASQEQSPDVEAMVDALAQRLQESPEDGEGWRMLGRSYMVLQRFKDSARAYSKATELLEENADLLVEYADAVGRSENSDLTGAAKPLIKRALELEPTHGKARWLGGMLAYQEQEFAQALYYLEPLLDQMDESSEVYQGMSMLLARARQELGRDVATSDQPDQIQPQQAVASQPVSLQVSVSLDEPLQDNVNADDTVFVFARAVSGTPIPLAVTRVKVRDLPVTVTLDDSMAMRPELTLSSHDQVNISARISKSGNAIAVPGDLQGEVKKVVTANPRTVEININQQLK